MDFVEFYTKQLRPLLIKWILKLPRYELFYEKNDLVNWRNRAELFNKALLCIDAFVNDPNRLEFELKLFKSFVENL